MAKPIISWLDKDLAPLSSIKFSSSESSYEPVIAEQASVTETLYIANNFTKGQETQQAVDDAVNCYLKVTDRNGTTNSVVVTELWTRAKCSTDTAQTDFTQIGLREDEEVKINITAGDPSRQNTIGGEANDGTREGSGSHNTAEVKMFVQPPLSTAAEGGVQQFRFVFVYSYGATV